MSDENMPNPFALAGFNAGLNEASSYLSFKRNQKEFDRRFEKQSYPNQVEEMRKAGLNPALMYSKGAMTAPNPSGKIAEPVDHNFAETSAELSQMNYQNMLLKQQAINEGFKGELTKQWREVDS